MVAVNDCQLQQECETKSGEAAARRNMEWGGSALGFAVRGVTVPCMSITSREAVVPGDYSLLAILSGFHRQHRISALPERGYLPVDVAELLVPVPVLRAFSRLLIQLHRIPHLPKTPCHRLITDRMTLSGQLCRHRFGRFIRPPQRAHRISRRRLFQDLTQLYWQPWVSFFHLFPSATRLSDLPLLRHRQFLPTAQLRHSLSDRRSRHPRQLR